MRRVCPIVCSFVCSKSFENLMLFVWSKSLLVVMLLQVNLTWLQLRQRS